MNGINDLKVFSLKVDSKFQIVGTNENIISYFRPEEAKGIITYLYSLKGDITVISSELKLNNQLYPVIIEGYRNEGISYLDIYSESFFFNNDKLITNDLSFNDLTFVYNLSANKIVYLKTNNQFLVLNNLTRLNPQILNSLSINKQEMEKLTTAFVKAVKSTDKKETKIIKLSLFNNEHHYKLDFKPKLINSRKYLILNATKADDIVVYQNKVRYYTKDALTGLLDYKGIQDSLKYILDNENQKSFAFTILDFEYLDKINSTYGQLFVDQITKLVSSLMIEIFKDEFTMARITSYKFILILKNLSTSSQVLELLELYSSKLKTLTFRGNNIDASFSSGTAFYPLDGNDFEQLYIKASKALIHSQNELNGLPAFYSDKQHAKYNVMLNEANNASKNQKQKSDVFLRKIIDKLLNSKEMGNSIDHILSKILEFYLLDRIVLLADINGKEYSHIKCRKEAYEDDFKNVNIELISSLDNSFDNENVTVVNNIETIKYISEDRYKHLLYTGTKSEIMFDLSNDNINKGYFIIHKCKEQHTWTDDEKINLSIIAKLLSSVLVTAENEKYMEKVAYKDSVTGYWNLNMLKEHIKQNNMTEFTIMTLNMYKFHLLNDTYGYDAGDKCLSDIAKFLKAYINPDELFCRIVDDKFMIITDCWDEEKLIEKHRDINLHIQQYLRKNHGISLELRTGIYFKKSTDTLSEAMDKASRSLNYITADMIDKVKFYSDDLLKDYEEEKFVESHINEAFEKEQFIIHLQPVVDLKKRKLYSAEALVRWKYNDKTIYPNSFIPILEKNHKIVDLDFAVYEQVFKFISSLREKNIPLFPISMNVSRCHLLSKNFITRLQELVEKYDINPKLIGLEITESAFVSGLNELKQFIYELKNLGFRIYIDDFGVAYSNISFLGQIPVDILKIDKGFLDHEVSEREYVILNNIANMARQLGMKVLCEGIEGEKELAIVKSLKFEYGQGYHYDKPLPVEVFIEKYLSGKKVKL